jgi:lysophospholipase L1-like esterase
MERIDVDCIRLQPDLVVIAEGTNDLRAGMRSADYAADLAAITSEIRRETQGLVVLVGVYQQVHGHGANDPAAYPDWSRWQPADLSTFSRVASEVAQHTGVLFVDALEVLGGMDIVLDHDGCHLNDLGHQLIGNAVFRTVILRDSFSGSNRMLQNAGSR